MIRLAPLSGNNERAGSSAAIITAVNVNSAIGEVLTAWRPKAPYCFDNGRLQSKASLSGGRMKEARETQAERLEERADGTATE